MFAVIKTGGKQYRVAADNLLQVEKIKGEPGEIVQFGEVLVVGGEPTTIGTPTVEGASVAAEVVEQGRGPKVIAFKKRRRKNSRRKRGHLHQPLTRIALVESRPVRESQATLVRWMGITDANSAGFVHGGTAGAKPSKAAAKPKAATKRARKPKAAEAAAEAAEKD